MEPLYICVSVPEFPAQVLLRLRQERKDAAVAVLTGDPPLETVCSTNTAAKRLGVQNGMTRAELDSFVGVHILKRSAEEERTASAALLDAAGAFTPRTQRISNQTSTFIMVLDMAGMSLLFGEAHQVVEAVEGVLKKLKFLAQIAGSANFHVAVCLASVARQRPILVSRGEERRCLASLPLSTLALTDKQSQTMELWGLQRLGDLAELPEVELVVRLGQEGKRLRLLARGEHPHLMVPEETAPALEELIGFDAPVEILDSLLFVIGPMLDQLLVRAQNHALALASVTVRLTLNGGGHHERTVRPALPVVQRELLLRLLHLDLQAHPPSAAVIGIFLCAESGDRSKVQLGLFAPQLPEPSRLDVALARIAAMVGEDRVGRARLLDVHRPDSFVMEPFAVAPAKAKVQPSAVGTTIVLRRYRPPLHIAVRVEGERLASLVFAGKKFSVKECYGPWRNSGDWWTATAWAHDEWDVIALSSDNESLLCRVAHDRLNHQWQMEALYD